MFMSCVILNNIVTWVKKEKNSVKDSFKTINKDLNSNTRETLFTASEQGMK